MPTGFPSNARRFPFRKVRVTLFQRTSDDAVRIEVGDRDLGPRFSMARSPVKQMRGHIDSLSEAGRGLIFVAELPIRGTGIAARERSDNPAVT